MEKSLESIPEVDEIVDLTHKTGGEDVIFKGLVIKVNRKGNKVRALSRDKKKDRDWIRDGWYRIVSDNNTDKGYVLIPSFRPVLDFSGFRFLRFIGYVEEDFLARPNKKYQEYDVRLKEKGL